MPMVRRSLTTPATWTSSPTNALVFSYVMTIDGRPISASLASVELFPAQAGIRIVYTEQGQYFDGGDQALQREIGCGELYDALGELLASAH